VGLAEASAARAHSYVRAVARKSVGTVPTSAMRLAKLVADVEVVRGLLASYSRVYEECVANGDLQSARLTIGLRNLKITSSETAISVATDALSVCGINGYQRNSPYSLDRLIRDAHGGLVMVSNDRYLSDNAQLLLVRKNL
jgi:acyl-CoA dehydrogenase